MTRELTDDARYDRQKDLVPISRLKDQKVTVIGTGAIGRQVALQLAAMGVPYLQLVDFDTVETENLAPQGFMETDLGLPKVKAVANLCRAINSTITVVPVATKYRKSLPVGDIIFCCVDKIDVREFIYNNLEEQSALFIDGRMSAEVLRILSVWNKEESKTHYRSTLFQAEEAYRGSCTAKSTIYGSNVIAGMMISSLTKWLRNMPLDRDITLNLLTNEFSAME